MSIIQISTAFNIDLEFELAAFHKRLLAYMIDFILLIAYLVSMKFVLYNGFSIGLHDNIGLDIIVISLPMLFYSLLTELWMNGQTFGKKLMSIRVISLDGGEATMGQYILRWITKFFEWPFLFGYMVFSESALYAYVIITGFLGIGVIICILVTKKGQRLGDLAAGTVIVDSKSELSIADTVFMDIREQDYKVMFPDVMRLSDGDINTIKSVLTQSQKRKNEDLCYRVETKVKEVLNIESTLSGSAFLEKLLEDYNYLATKE
jgi:uncharacterized RDD family membrane protein YckC